MVNKQGNISHVEVAPKFSDFALMALSITAEPLNIDSEKEN